MPRKPEILEACQDYGLVLGKTLIEYAGWRARGSESFDPRGSVNHHTAGARVGDLPSIQTLVNGRSDLPGPLCNGALSRSGNIHLIAAGKANHAGEGGWKGLTGNSSVWGLECEHYGYPDEAVSDKQWDTMYRWHAACMDVSGKANADTVCQHFEWAPTRKIDFVKQLIVSQGGVDGFRSKVTAKNPISKPDPGDDDMGVPFLCVQLLKADGSALDGKVWAVSADYVTKRHIKDQTELNGFLFISGAGGGATEVYKPKVTEALGLMTLRATDVETMVTDTEFKAAMAALPGKVVDALPPSSGGGGATPEQVEVACEKAIKDSGLLGLLPGQ